MNQSNPATIDSAEVDSFAAVVAGLLERNSPALAHVAGLPFYAAVDKIVRACSLAEIENQPVMVELAAFEAAAALRGDPAPLTQDAALIIATMVHMLAVAHRRESETAEVKS